MPTRSFGDIRVELSRQDKVIFPRTGTTKGEVIDYFIEIAPALIPHIAGRPVTRKRWPNGVEAASFFEKNLVSHAPDWIERKAIEHKDRAIEYPLFDTVAGLAWLGQQAALEIHVPQWRFVDDEPGPATRLVFDLDPGDNVSLAQCAEVAIAVRDMIADGTIAGGMIPKIETCIYAIDQGVDCGGTGPHLVERGVLDYTQRPGAAEMDQEAVVLREIGQECRPGQGAVAHPLDEGVVGIGVPVRGAGPAPGREGAAISRGLGQGAHSAAPGSTASRSTGSTSGTSPASCRNASNRA